MKIIKIDFVDFWQGFDKKNNFIYRLLKDHYEIIIDAQPDYLFYSTYGWDHLKYDCIKIFFTAENDVPDFNLCDYAIGSNYITFQDRYIRLPLCSLRKAHFNLNNSKSISKEEALNRKFCNYVYSNNMNAHPIREHFYHFLSLYKPVDSGGSSLNNIGYKVADKIQFISEYKFTIAFENSLADGYTTEKIVEPMAANTIPIYWGNPLVGLDFNEKSFIRLAGTSDIEISKTIDQIKFLDNNDEAYLNMLSEPWFLPGQNVEYETILLDFLHNILAQSYEKAARRTKFGRNEINTNKLIFVLKNQKGQGVALKKLKKLGLKVLKASRIK